MARTKLNFVALLLGLNEVSFLAISSDDIIAETKPCNTTSDWVLIIKQLFIKHKVSSKTKVHVVLGVGTYTSIQLPKNELLSEEELRGIAMYKDLEGAVNGNIADYVWDFYDAKTGKNARPQQTFVLVNRRLVALISDTVNSLAELSDITVSELAMAEFISSYQYYSVNKSFPQTPSKYINQLCIALYLKPDNELMVYGVYGGELCYFRILRGYKTLTSGVVGGFNDPVLIKLTTDILRLSDDFFTSQLGLPPMSKLLLLIDSDQTETITQVLSNNFRRVVDVVPIGNSSFIKTPTGYTICEEHEINTIAKHGGSFLQLFGLYREGLLLSEEN